MQRFFIDIITRILLCVYFATENALQFLGRMDVEDDAAQDWIAKASTDDLTAMVFLDQMDDKELVRALSEAKRRGSAQLFHAVKSELK